MKGLLRFVGRAIAGGFAMLLPIVVVLLLVELMWRHLRPIGEALHHSVFPEAESSLGPLVVVVLLVLLLAFLAGLFIRSRSGSRVFRRLEATILDPLPPYVLLRQIVRDMAGGAARLDDERSTCVVMVHFDDFTTPGVHVETLPDGRVTVFLPGAPNAFGGTIAIVRPDQITHTTMSSRDLLATMRRFGAGLPGREETAPPGNDPGPA